MVSLLLGRSTLWSCYLNMIAPICHLFLHILILQQNYKLIMGIIWLILLVTEDLLANWITSLIGDLMFAMQYNISLSIWRIPGHLIFRLHCEFFDTSETIPVKVCFWQVILLSNWFLFAMQIGDRVSIRVNQSVDFLSLLEAHLFVGSQKNRSPFPYPQQELSIALWEELWLNWHGSIAFLLIWDLCRSSQFWFIPIDNTARGIGLPLHMATIPRRPDFSVLCFGFFSSHRSLHQSPIWAISPHRSRQVGNLSLPSSLRGGGWEWYARFLKGKRKVKTTTTSSMEIQIGENTCVKTKYPLLLQWTRTLHISKFVLEQISAVWWE